MSRTQFVKYQEQGFWAYDVALGIFLKHLIDAAEPRVADLDEIWLADAISSWRVVAGLSDLAFIIDEPQSAIQISVFIDLANEACQRLETYDSISAEEIESWKTLHGIDIFPRGAERVPTGPVIELGRAVAALVEGTLPTAPADTVWFYGTETGRRTIQMRAPE